MNEELNQFPLEDPALANFAELDDGSVEIAEIADNKDSSPEFCANLAESLAPAKLNQLASDLLDLIEKDKNARKKRDEQYEEGLRRTGLGNDAPGGATFDGSSRVVHPVMAEGCIDFSARAMRELFPAKGPVKTAVKDADEQKLERARRKRDFLNWQLTQQIEEYRAEKEQLYTQLPLGGSQFEKYWFDPAKGRICMEFVPVDKVLLPFAATSFYTSPRVTHVQELTRQIFEQRVKSGFYVDVVDLITDLTPEESASQVANDKIEGRQESGYNEDGVRTVYEVVCWWALENEDEPYPYIISIDDATQKVLAVYRNWREGDELHRKLDWWVEDVFIPWRGAYGIGLPHLIGGLSAALTGALRALLDSAHINNVPSMLKLKAGRVVGQNTTIDVTQVTEIEGPAGVSDIRQIAMPMPFNPPSPVLQGLLDWLTNAAKGVVSTAEERIADASNTMPVGTALALIEQGSQIFSSIHARLHASQARALQIICRLNHDFPDVDKLNEHGLTLEDFDKDDDITPVSDPNIFSEAQRYAQLQEMLKIMAAFPDLKWDRDNIARQSMELLRIDDIDSKLKAKDKPINGNPIVENAAAIKGIDLKVDLKDDHVAHATCHLQFLIGPFGAQNPLTPPRRLAELLGHAQEHLNEFYVTQAQAAMPAAAVQIGFQGNHEGINEARVAVMAQAAMIEGLGEQGKALAALVTMAMQMVKKRQPQPPQDPSVAASIKIAEMENQRKSALDQATLSAKQAQQQAEQQLAAAELQLKQIQQSFDQRMEQMAQFIEQQQARQQQQLELLKNEQDNRQHQITELLKNRDDNETAKIIEAMKQTLSALPFVAQQTNPAEASAQVLQAQALMEQAKEV